MVVLFHLVGLAVATVQLAPPLEVPDAGVEDIIVRARPGALRPPDDAIDQFRRYCYEPARTLRRPVAPEEDGDWQALADADRLAFGISDPETQALDLVDETRNQRLVMRVERLHRDGRLREDRCTLVVIGGDNHRRFVREMAGLYGGPGTERHVGKIDGQPALPGWRQWMWSGMPRRESRAWRLPRSRSPGGSWLVVSDTQNFYRTYDYLLGDLKTREGDGTPISMLTFSLTTRDE